MFSTGNMQKRKWSLHIDPNIDPILDDSKCHVSNLKSSKLGYGVTLNLWHGTNDCSVMLQYQARWVRVTIRTQRENVDMQTNVRCQCSRRHIFDIFKFHRRWHPCMSLKGHSNGNIIMEILIPTKSMYSDTEPACTHETHNCEALRMDTHVEIEVIVSDVHLQHKQAELQPRHPRLLHGRAPKSACLGHRPPNECCSQQNIPIQIPQQTNKVLAACQSQQAVRKESSSSMTAYQLQVDQICLQASKS